MAPARARVHCASHDHRPLAAVGRVRALPARRRAHARRLRRGAGYVDPTPGRERGAGLPRGRRRTRLRAAVPRPQPLLRRGLRGAARPHPRTHHRPGRQPRHPPRQTPPHASVLPRRRRVLLPARPAHVRQQAAGAPRHDPVPAASAHLRALVLQFEGHPLPGHVHDRAVPHAPRVPARHAGRLPVVRRGCGPAHEPARHGHRPLRRRAGAARAGFGGGGGSARC